MGNTLSSTAVRAIGNSIANILPAYTKATAPTLPPPKTYTIIDQQTETLKVYQELV